MAPVFESVKTEWGLHLTPEGAQLATSSMKAAPTAAKIKEHFLQADLRKCQVDSQLESHFPEVTSSKTGSIDGKNKYLCQAIKSLDITKPARLAEMFEEARGGAAKRIMLVTMTDGKQKFSALECNPMKAFKSGAIAPGTKFLLQGPLKFRNGLLLLGDDSSITHLGGKVEALYEAWQQARTVEETRALVKFQGQKEITEGGPPQFIPFEKRGKVKIEKVVIKPKEADERPKNDDDEKGPRFDASKFGAEQLPTIQNAKKDAFKQKEKESKGKGKGRRRNNREVDEEAAEYEYSRGAGGGLDLSAFVAGGAANSSSNATRRMSEDDEVAQAIKAVQQFELSEKKAKEMQAGYGKNDGKKQGKGDKKGDGNKDAKGSRK